MDRFIFIEVTMRLYFLKKIMCMNDQLSTLDSLVIFAQKSFVYQKIEIFHSKE